MNVYPHVNPLILTDNIFAQYGGQTGTFTQAQRQAAYVIAEQQATTFLNTFLLPTTVTGSWGASNRIVTDYGYVHQILSVNIISRDGYSQTCQIHRESGCVFVWDDTFGYLDVGCLLNYCNCNYRYPYKIEVAYQAGLPTGVASQPAVHLALTMAAQISLNEMIYPSQNESTGDAGVEEFASLDYREKRKAWKNTAFGSSVKAAKIAQLLESTIKPARHALLMR